MALPTWDGLGGAGVRGRFKRQGVSKGQGWGSQTPLVGCQLLARPAEVAELSGEKDADCLEASWGNRYAEENHGYLDS